MTPPENTEKYESAVRNWTVQNLKADKDFMAACRDDVEFREYVVYHRPDMRNDKQPKIKFLGLGHSKVPATDKSETEPSFTGPEDEPAGIPRAVQYYRDVVKMRDGLL